MWMHNGGRGLYLVVLPLGSAGNRVEACAVGRQDADTEPADSCMSVEVREVMRAYHSTGRAGGHSDIVQASQQLFFDLTWSSGRCTAGDATAT